MTTYAQFENIKVKNREDIKNLGFSRNNNDKCWEFKKIVNKNNDYSSFVIRIYDEEINIENHFTYHFYCFNNYATYHFNEFFNEKDYVFSGAKELQELFLETINYLIEQEVIEFEENSD